MPNIHSTAVISRDAILGNDVDVAAYAVIEGGVKVGNGTKIAYHAVLKKGTEVGENCLIDSFASLGGIPQDKKFDARVSSGVVIGNATSVREHVVIHRASRDSGLTSIGSNCMIQSGSHVAHDCEVGDDTVLASGCMMGGRSKVGKHCFIGGGAAIHQNVIIGDYVMLGGNSATSLSIPPYMLSAGVSVIVGLNMEALRRAAMPAPRISLLKKCVAEFYGRFGFFPDRAKAMLTEGWATTPETENFLKFFTAEAVRNFAPLRRRKKNVGSL